MIIIIIIINNSHHHQMNPKASSSKIIIIIINHCHYHHYRRHQSSSTSPALVVIIKDNHHQILSISITFALFVWIKVTSTNINVTDFSPVNKLIRSLGQTQRNQIKHSQPWSCLTNSLYAKRLLRGQKRTGFPLASINYCHPHLKKRSSSFNREHSLLFSLCYFPSGMLLPLSCRIRIFNWRLELGICKQIRFQL